MKKLLALILSFFGLSALIGIKAALAVLFLGSALALCLWINAKAGGKYNSTPKARRNNDAFNHTWPVNLRDLADPADPDDPLHNID